MPEINTLSLLNDANLQGYYRLENGALTTDSSSHNRTLTDHGTVGSVAGLYGNGAAFTGSDKYFSKADAYGFAGSLTLMGWVKIGAEPSTQQYNIMFLGDAATSVNYWIDYMKDTGGGNRGLQFARFKVGTATQYTFYDVTLGTSLWHHIAMTYDGTNIRGYVDGVKVVTSATVTGNGSGGSDAFNIAQDTVNGDANSDHGVYDDMAVFNRALSDAEILSVYAAAVQAGGFFFTGV